MKQISFFNVYQRFFGAVLLFFGLNKIFSFIPIPEKEGFAKIFLQTLNDSHYLLPTIVSIQVISGLCLILNRLVGIALLILLPVSYNIMMFHMLHDFSFVPLLIAASNLLLMINQYFYKEDLWLRILKKFPKFLSQ